MTIEKVIDKIKRQKPDADVDLVKKAFEFAQTNHKGQMRLSGEEFITHPVEVASILADLNLDEITISSALMHDVVEDTEAKIEDVKKEFGSKIAEMVEGVTKLNECDFIRKDEDIEAIRERTKIENLRRLFLAMAKDVRVVIIKLADRLHNMRTLEYRKERDQKRKALETLEIYAPLADRLGMGEMKAELEDLSFKYLYPDEYKKVAKAVESTKKEREHYIAKVEKFIKKELDKNGIEAKIDGRVKHLYSVHKKLEKVGGDISKIYDLMAIRIIVDNVEDCYKALGIIHKHFKPLIYRIKDYIAIPKPNGYQSLHTTVFALDGKITEIQIRTMKMHIEAEQGVAAHWYYSEQKKDTVYKGKVLQAPKDKMNWVNKIINWSDNLTAEEFQESLKIDIFNDRIYVFSPKGEIFELPDGATPIDFAYEVHTQVGHRCRGARINGKMGTLEQKLANRDVVEIVLAPKNDKSGPSRGWLEFVQTQKARQNIRSFLKKLNWNENIEAGKKLLTDELSMFGMNEEDLNPTQIKDLISDSTWKNWEDILVAIGEGSITARQILKKIVGQKLYTESDKMRSKNEETIEQRDSYSNLGGVLVRYAACCKPVAGDEIKGFITRGQGITIHKANCPNLLASPQERVINIDFEIPKTSRVQILIEGENRIGFIRDITHIVSEEKININDIRNEHIENRSKIYLDVALQNPDALADLLHRLVLVNGVVAVRKV
jgi:GTP pyrophosphokinase